MHNINVSCGLSLPPGQCKQQDAHHTYPFRFYSVLNVLLLICILMASNMFARSRSRSRSSSRSQQPSKRSKRAARSVENIPIDTILRATAATTRRVLDMTPCSLMRLEYLMYFFQAYEVSLRPGATPYEVILAARLELDPAQIEELHNGVWRVGIPEADSSHNRLFHTWSYQPNHERSAGSHLEQASMSDANNLTAYG